MKTIRTNVIEAIESLWNNRSINGVGIADDIRIANVSLLADYYLANTGRCLSRLMMESLTEYCLYRGTDKGRTSRYFTDEYPYQTEQQIRSRGRREKSLEFAINHDSNGNSRAPKTRKNRRELNEAMNVIKWRVSESQTDNSIGV